MLPVLSWPINVHFPRGGVELALRLTLLNPRSRIRCQKRTDSVDSLWINHATAAATIGPAKDYGC